jgi:Transposase DDE domain
VASIHTKELWIGDRNMCTKGFLWGLHERGANFVIREHKSMPTKVLEPLQQVGYLEVGDLFEQRICLCARGKSLSVRRVVLKLKKPTRNGESEIAILTMLPPDVATPALVTELYRSRRSVENLFQTVTENYECEIQTLGYPKAALFSFCLALVAYNILATVRAVLASVHGVGKISAGLSDYYMVDEVQATYRGMMIAIPPSNWYIFTHGSLNQLVTILQNLAHKVRLSSFLKQTRAPKKKKKPPSYDPRHPHVSTAKLLEARSSP